MLNENQLISIIKGDDGIFYKLNTDNINFIENNKKEIIKVLESAINRLIDKTNFTVLLLDLDNDKLGKLGYTFDYCDILQKMSEDVKEHIVECKLWNKQEIEKLFNRLYERAKKNDRYANRAKSLIQRLYLISAWYNNNKYIER